MSQRQGGATESLTSWPIPTLRLAGLAGATAVLFLVLPDQGSTGILGIEVDNRFLTINAVVLLLATVDYLLAPNPGTLTVSRLHPGAVAMGRESNVEWVVARPKRRTTLWSAGVWLADDLAPSLRADTRRVKIKVAAGGSTSARVRIRPTRRGRFTPSEMTLRCSGPAGLVVKQRRRAVRSTLRVLPQFRSAREAELALHRARLLEVGLRSARCRGGGTDFDSLRELTPDDETRRVDWAATARSNRPIVRTYQAEQNQTLLVLLDAGRVMAAQVDGAPRLEFGMDAAMLLAELATGLGDRMGLLVFDREVHTTLPPHARRSQRTAVSEAVFDLEPALDESDYRSMVTHVATRYRRRSLLVLVTELAEEVVEAFLMPSLPLLTRTHLLIVAAVRDPQVEAWAMGLDLGSERAGVATVDEGFRRAAAIAELESRRRVAARLRAKGAIVVDAIPAKFASALGEAYLEAKAIGRL
ncbi:MAG: DUF58 domain-containing protein [Actinomycetota bacterium]|nr:DUF58 domain-containing protein [Actinomycetota bacterium]